MESTTAVQSQNTSAVTDDRYLSFKLDSNHLAIPLLEVKEVIGITTVTHIPQAPAYFKGIINLRGSVISIIDLRTKLGIKGDCDSSEKAVIILDSNEQLIGLVVDSIESVMNFQKSDISSSSEFDLSNKGVFLGAAKKEDLLVLLLNVSGTLNKNDISIAKAQSAKPAA